MAKKMSKVQKAVNIISTHSEVKSRTAMIGMIKRRCDTTDLGARSFYYTAKAKIDKGEV